MTHPTPSQRLGLLALSLLLPVLLVGVMAAWFVAFTAMSQHHRSLAWVQGTPVQLERLRASMLEHPVFPDADFLPGGFARLRPVECGSDAIAVGFKRLRDFELPVARTTLDELLRRSGVQACDAQVTVYNDLPNPLEASAWDDSLVTALLAVILPTGILLVAYWGFGTTFALPAPWHVPRPAWRTLGIGLGGAVAGLAVVQLLAAAMAWAWPDAPLGSDAIHGLGPDPLSPLVLLLVGMYAPFLEELAFRAWLIPVAERAIGLLPACTLSVLAFTAIHLPFAGPELPGTIALGGVFAAVYGLTRSLPACIVAHGGYNALALWLYVATTG